MARPDEVWQKIDAVKGAIKSRAINYNYHEQKLHLWKLFLQEEIEELVIF